MYSHFTNLLLACMFLSNLSMTFAAEIPAWWTERGVLIPGAQADDFAIANIGQLKAIATKAAEEMDARLQPTGAGSEIYTLVSPWSNPLPTTDDFAAVNQGQLKAVAAPFYNRLADLGYTAQPLLAGQLYPWTESTIDDDSFSAVNLGQMKFVFCFLVPGGSGAAYDTDLDGLPDAWELQYWTTLVHEATDDIDSDGVSNLEEFQLGMNPTKAAILNLVGAVSLSVNTPLN